MHMLSKVDLRWSGGIVADFGLRSNAHPFGIVQGMVRAHSIKRLPDDDCWGGGLLGKLEGTPLGQLTSNVSIQFPAHINDEG